MGVKRALEVWAVVRAVPLHTSLTASSASLLTSATSDTTHTDTDIQLAAQKTQLVSGGAGLGVWCMGA